MNQVTRAKTLKEAHSSKDNRPKHNRKFTKMHELSTLIGFSNNSRGVKFPRITPHLRRIQGALPQHFSLIRGTVTITHTSKQGSTHNISILQLSITCHNAQLPKITAHPVIVALVKLSK